MPHELIIAFAGLCLYTAAMWALGWHYGARAFRDRNRLFIAQMRDFNENQSPKSQWFKGYNEGIAAVLSQLELFLDQFSAEGKHGTP